MKSRRNLWKRAAVFCLAGVLLMSGTGQTAVRAAETQREERSVEEGETIRISSVEDFLEFVKNCRNDLYSYGRVFSLEKDLELDGAEFFGVPYFCGTFEGNGHTVKGVMIAQRGSDYGFFRYIGHEGCVRNLTVQGSVSLEGDGENVGGIAGVNDGLIEACRFVGSVKGKSAVGGIVGQNRGDGIVSGSEMTGIVKATDRTGGICGENKGILLQCTNHATVNGDDLKVTLDLDGVDLGMLNLTQNVVTRNDCGGIAGLSVGTITECINEGEIGYAHVGYNVGGIVGRQSGTVINCENSGPVWGRKDVAGIVGQAEPYRESEYLSEHLEKIRNDFSTINRLVIQMSDALSSTSTDTREYTQALQQQYENTISRLNDEVNSLKSTVSDNNGQIRDYMNSLSSSLENLGSIGNDTVKKISDSIEANAKRIGDQVQNGIRDKIEELETKVSEAEKPTESESTEEESSSAEESSSEEEGGAEEGSSQSSDQDSNREEENVSRMDGDAIEEEAAEGAWFGRERETVMDGQEEDSRADDQTEKPEEPDHSGGETGERPEFPTDITFPDEKPEFPTDITLPDEDEIKDKLEQIAGSAKKEIEPIEIVHDEQIDRNLDNMHGELTSITGNLRSLQDTLLGTGESVTDTASNISGELTQQSQVSGDTIDGLTNSVDAGIQSVTANLNSVMNRAQHISDFVSDDIDILMGNGNSLLDISSETAQRSLGVISGCKNMGSVEGDINVGGIAGNMNVEYDIDPELDPDLARFTDVEVRTVTNDVVIHAVNYGNIKAKKNNCGGITGSEELGLIHDCESYGDISTESGTALGGIAGLSGSRINACYAFCNITGSALLGGIVGDGYDISGCSAMCTILGEERENIGSIAGRVNEEATVSGNVFVQETWGGIDNISYIGRAEEITYEQMMERENTPQGFTTVTVIFEKNGEILKTMELAYGSVVSKEDVPDASGDTDCYLEWDRTFPTEQVCSNIRIEAREKYYVQSLAAGGEEDKPDFIVEGVFYENTRLIAEQIPAPQELPADACAYTWRLEDAPGREESYILHCKRPGKEGQTQVWVQNGDGWEQIETKEDGSYVTAAVSYGAAFAVGNVQKRNLLPVYITGVVCLAALAWIILRIYKKNSRKM